MVHTITAASAEQLPRHEREAQSLALALEVHRNKYAYAGDVDLSVPGGISKIYRELVADEARLQQIYGDVMAAYAANSRILVLTTRKADLEKFRAKFVHAGLAPMVLTGGMKKAETQAAVELIEAADPAKPLLVLGTGSFIGEGIDAPKLDTLSWRRPSLASAGLSNTPGASPGRFPVKARRPSTTTTTNSPRFCRPRLRSGHRAMSHSVSRIRGRCSRAVW